MKTKSCVRPLLLTAASLLIGGNLLALEGASSSSELPAAGVLIAGGASWAMPGKGILWSLLAGAVGAIGAFGVLLALAKAHPAVVMSIVFAGAPIVNALVSLAIHPPAGGWSGVRWQFLAGIVLAACGGMLVTMYKPGTPPPKPADPPGAQTTDR